MEHKIVFVYSFVTMNFAIFFSFLVLYCVAPVNTLCCEVLDKVGK
jgi:hypothetical protein